MRIRARWRLRAPWDLKITRQGYTFAQRPFNARSCLGAGPLEDLLSGYGEKFIERIERQAAADTKFRLSLAGVWQSGMSDELWRRVTNALGDQDRYPN